MARNKYPEQTENKILDASLKLFLEKGYDHTTIQDIVDNLGGLTKGAIYHHFKSKEDIFIAIANRMGLNVEHWMNEVLADSTKTGLEKLRYIFQRSLDDPNQTYFSESGVELIENPKLLAIWLKDWITETIPRYIQPVIEEGVRDGSIQTEYPKELAEVTMLLINLWLSPGVGQSDRADLERRLAFFDQLLRSMGLPLLDDSLREDLLSYINKWENSRTSAKSK